MASPLIIRVRAVPGVLVPVPKLRGTVAQYVGRRVDHAAIAAKAPLEQQYPIDGAANSEFHRADADSNAVFVAIYTALTRDRVLLPADEATAKWADLRLPTSRNDCASLDAEWHRLSDATA